VTDSVDQMRRDPPGPLLAVAALAERVLTEQDGVVSLVRIVDHFTFQPPRSAVESDEEWRGVVDATAYVSFKAGGFSGPATIRLEPVFPGDERRPGIDVPIEFPDPAGGANLVVKINLATRTPGVYWYDVYLNEKRVTSIPFRISIEPRDGEDEPPEAR
jgi:hypothetical protein